MNDIYDFGSFDDGLKLDFMGGSDNRMEIDIVEPAAKAVGSKPKTVKKVVVSGSGLAKSRNTGGGKSVRASEKEGKEAVKSMVKGKAEIGIEEQNSQVSHLEGSIVGH